MVYSICSYQATEGAIECRRSSIFYRKREMESCNAKRDGFNLLQWCIGYLVKPPKECKPVGSKWVFKQTQNHCRWINWQIQGSAGRSRLFTRKWPWLWRNFQACYQIWIALHSDCTRCTERSTVTLAWHHCCILKWRVERRRIHATTRRLCSRLKRTSWSVNRSTVCTGWSKVLDAGITHWTLVWRIRVSFNPLVIHASTPCQKENCV